MIKVECPYLAIVQQMFTFPSQELEPLIQRLYEIQPEAEGFFANFRRPLPEP